MRRILVVDDNLASRELLHAVLKAPDREIVEASEGEEALEKIAESTPDLVLLDIEMPLLNGFAVLRKLRENPRFAGLRVLAVTAHAMQGAREDALAAGFDGYITKPVNAAAVRKQVADFLGA